MFYAGTHLGCAVSNFPVMVREFSVKSETSRSFVVEYGLKVNKKTMQLNCKNYLVDMFETAEAAKNSLTKKL